jgi:hypothetical protein
MVSLLTQRRFRRVSFAIVREHVERIKDLTVDELGEAVMRYHEENKHFDTYHTPFVENVLPYLSGHGETNKREKAFEEQEFEPSSGEMSVELSGMFTTMLSGSCRDLQQEQKLAGPAPLSGQMTLSKRVSLMRGASVAQRVSVAIGAT